MQSNELKVENEPGLRSRIGRVAPAAGLWLLTSALSFVLIPTVLDMSTRIYAAFWGDYGFYGRSYWSAVALRQFLTFPMTLFALMVIIGGAEYHSRNLGSPASWRMFGRTLALELALLAMAAIV